MEQRVLIIVLLVVGLFVAFMFFFNGGDAPDQRAARQQGELPAASSGDNPFGEPIPTAGTAPQQAEAPAAAAPAGPPEQIVTVRDPGKHRVELTTRGARIRSFKLLDSKFLVGDERAGLLELIKGWISGKETATRHGEPRPLDLVTIEHEPYYPLGLTLPRSGLQLTGREEYEVVSATAQQVIFRWRDPQGRATIEKEYRFYDDQYLFDLIVRVTNTGGRTLTEIPSLTTTGRQDPESAEGGLFSGIPNVRGAICKVDDELIREPVGDLTPTWQLQTGEVTWAGTEDQYFLMVLVPQNVPQDRRQLSGCAYQAQKDLLVSAISVPAQQLAPGESSSHLFKAYFGPKEYYHLKSLGWGLEQAVDFGWLDFICQPMLWLMRLFHSWIPNWGLAIIFLTVFVKLLLLYPTNKSMRSMADMQKLKPEMEELRAKFGEDKQRLNQEMLSLYKKHNVNPLGGCLPMIIQLPIYFALYRTIYSSVELYHADFFWYLDDLSSPDPYFITPLLLGVIMFAQQRLMPTTMDNVQAKMMMWMMPIMFTAFMLFLPSGLVVYILANSVLSIIQQLVIQRRRTAVA